MKDKSITQIVGKTELDKYIAKILKESPATLKISSKKIDVKKDNGNRIRTTFMA